MAETVHRKGVARDLTGEVYGRLTVKRKERDKLTGSPVWVAECVCGNETRTTQACLTTGHTKSCGCLRLEALSENRKANRGKRHVDQRKQEHPDYRRWVDMRSRCNNPNHHAYAHYGGRGITICKRWDDFWAFVTDMGSRPLGTTMHRKNNDKGYCKSNCKWATRDEQAAEKQNTIKITIGGVRKPLVEWVRESGLKYGTVRKRWANGDRGKRLLRPSRNRKRNSIEQ